MKLLLATHLNDNYYEHIDYKCSIYESEMDARDFGQ
jgi:hypothetical protein